MLTGIKVEGILRQSADVEEVDQRVQEYEQGFLCFILVNVLEDIISLLVTMTAFYLLLWLIMIQVWVK